MRDYKIMPLNQILKYEDEMKEQKVSEVARKPNGFLGMYKRYKTFDNFKDKQVPNGKINWAEKRNAFADRHLAQYERHPTPRRRLALIAWGVLPNAK